MAEDRNDILMQIAQQALSVRQTFQDDKPRNTVSTATAAATAQLALMNKKRAAEETVPVLRPPSKKQALMNSTRRFHSTIAYLTTRNTSNSPCKSYPVTTYTVPAAVIQPRDPSLRSATDLNAQVQQIQVSNNDVVCGSSEYMNAFVGNRRYRVWIDLHSKSFAKAQKVEEKLKIARSVVHTVQACVPRGRFLTMDTCNGTCKEIGYENAVIISMRVLMNMTKIIHGEAQLKPIPSHEAVASTRKPFASMAA